MNQQQQGNLNKKWWTILPYIKPNDSTVKLPLFQAIVFLPFILQKREEEEKTNKTYGQLAKKYLQVHRTFFRGRKNHFYHCIRFMLSEWIQNLILLLFFSSIDLYVRVRVRALFFPLSVHSKTQTDELNVMAGTKANVL